MIAVRRDRRLAQLLETIEIDSPITGPEFAAVAEILAHLSNGSWQRIYARAANS